MPLSTGYFKRLSTLAVLAGCVVASAAHAQGRRDAYYYRLGFSLSVPADWTTEHDVGGAHLLAFAPPSGAKDGFRENLNVSVEGVPRGEGLTEVYRRGFAVMSEGLAGFEVIEEEETTVGRLPARRLVYEHVWNRKRLRVLAYLVLTPGRCFTLTGTAPARRFEAFLPVFEEMAQSFRPD